MRTVSDPAMEDDRILVDFKQAYEITKQLDSESGIQGILSLIKEEEPRKSLDLLLTYLRLVHLYCYYCNLMAENNEDMIKKCGNIHLRKQKGMKQDWTLGFDERIKSRVTKISFSDLERTVDTEILKSIIKLEEEKFKCSYCAKLFKAPSFVEKHIVLKHPEVKDSLQEGVLFFNNFLKDTSDVPEPIFGQQFHIRKKY